MDTPLIGNLDRVSELDKVADGRCARSPSVVHLSLAMSLCADETAVGAASSCFGVCVLIIRGFVIWHVGERG